MQRTKSQCNATNHQQTADNRGAHKALVHYATSLRTKMLFIANADFATSQAAPLVAALHP
jgi:hypothetical protein